MLLLLLLVLLPNWATVIVAVLRTWKRFKYEKQTLSVRLKKMLDKPGFICTESCLPVKVSLFQDTFWMTFKDFRKNESEAELRCVSEQTCSSLNQYKSSIITVTINSWYCVPLWLILMIMPFRTHSGTTDLTVYHILLQ